MKITNDRVLPSWLTAISLMIVLTILSGITLRWIYVAPIKWLAFTNLLHAHSHLAILGWVYLAIIALFYFLFVQKEQRTKTATILFIMTAAITVVMFFAFIYEGYALFSIASSSLHVLATYAFFIYFFRLVKNNDSPHRSISGLYIKGSVFFLIVGSLGPWLLAYWNGAQLPKNFFYDILVHTFLHFEINGWITLAILGILLYLLDREGGLQRTPIFRIAFWFYSISLLPGLVLNVDWTQGSMALFPVALIGWVLKMIGVSLVLFGLIKHTTWMRSFTRWSKLFLIVAIVSLFGKTLVEFGNTIPSLIDFSMGTRNVVIGYLHLGLIGFASFSLLAFFIKLRWIHHVPAYSYSLLLFGFILYIGLLFGDGLYSVVAQHPIPNIQVLLFISTILLSVGVMFILFQGRQKSMKK